MQKASASKIVEKSGGGGGEGVESLFEVLAVASQEQYEKLSFNTVAANLIKQPS